MRAPLAGVTLVPLVLVLIGVACGGEKPTIRLHAWEVDSHFLNNAIVEFISEEGYGYPVETVVETTPVLKQTLPAGEIDLNLEGWQQNIPEWYEEHLGKGRIVNLGMNFEAGPQFFIIPRWVSERYDIQTVFDLQDRWKLFNDPNDASKGIFYNGIIGWEATTINEIKLEAYGLTRYYNVVPLGSADALEAVLSRSQQSRQPVVGCYWAPNALIRAYEWHILEEPDYTDECREKITAATADFSLRPTDEACNYPDHSIDKLAHSGLKDKAPDLVEMLEKMSVGLEPLNESLAWVDQNGVEDWRAGAVHYLRTNEERWKTWVTAEAYEKVKSALGAASS